MNNWCVVSQKTNKQTKKKGSKLAFEMQHIDIENEHLCNQLLAKRGHSCHKHLCCMIVCVHWEWSGVKMAVRALVQYSQWK